MTAPLSIGFTGTRHGMTVEQLRTLEWLLDELARTEPVFAAHHGDCVGADAQFHDLLADLTGDHTIHIVVHPGPAYDTARQAGRVGHERRDPLPHLMRNHNIVTESTVVIAAPRELDEQRGGTWATIRMARRAGKPLAIVHPRGRVLERERWR
jgi:hypothetical protein